MPSSAGSGAEGSAIALNDLRDRLEMYMHGEGLRWTHQRRIVTEIFFASEGHLTIEEVLRLARKKDPKIGYATVYRTLKMLDESGLASSRQFGDGMTRYEVAEDGHHHDHLICIQCGAIEEFEDDEIEALQEAIAQRYRFKLQSHKHELYGWCAKCTATQV